MSETAEQSGAVFEGATEAARERVLDLSGRLSQVVEPMRLEDAVPVAVAALLQAEDDAGLLRAMVSLVEACGCRVEVGESDPAQALRRLPDALRASGGRDLTLGPVLRALCAAAGERASGGLAPPRSPGRRGLSGATTPVPGGGATLLLSLDLGDGTQVRHRLGDPGARWLVTKLQRTLRSLLQADERALRYPAGRFLILLHRTSAERARAFADRLAWEWSSYLGQAAEVSTHQAEVHDGDVVGALRALR